MKFQNIRDYLHPDLAKKCPISEKYEIFKIFYKSNIK
jgi:hypothetical protein